MPLPLLDIPVVESSGGDRDGFLLPPGGVLEPMDVLHEDPEEEDDWTSTIYTRLNGPRRRDGATDALGSTVAWPVSRLCMVLFSVLLLISSVGLGMVSGFPIFQNVTKKWTYQSFFFPFSYPIYGAGSALGALLFVVGMLGIQSSVPRRRCSWSSRPFVLSTLAVLFVCIIAFGGFVVYVARYNEGVHTHVAGRWREAVATHPELACEMQDALSCSGLSNGMCCAWALHHPPGSTDVGDVCFLLDPGETPSFYDPDSQATVEWPSEVCPLSCGSVGTRTTRPCDEAFQSSLETFYVRLLTCLLTAAVSSFCFIAVTVVRMAPRTERPLSFIEHEF